MSLEELQEIKDMYLSPAFKVNFTLTRYLFSLVQMMTQAFG